jgi:hypothetical protein
MLDATGYSAVETLRDGASWKSALSDPKTAPVFYRLLTALARALVISASLP